MEPRANSRRGSVSNIDDLMLPLNSFRQMKGPHHPFITIDKLQNAEEKPFEWRNVPVPLVEFSESVLFCMKEIKKQIHDNYNDVSKLNRAIGINDRYAKQEIA